MLRPYLYPSCSATPVDRPRQSVPGVLRDQRIGVDLRLRNRHQHDFVRCGAIAFLELPASGVLAVPDQILAPLSFTVELEQPLAQDHVGGDGAERVPPPARASGRSRSTDPE